MRYECLICARELVKDDEAGGFIHPSDDTKTPVSADHVVSIEDQPLFQAGTADIGPIESFAVSGRVNASKRGWNTGRDSETQSAIDAEISRRVKRLDWLVKELAVTASLEGRARIAGSMALNWSKLREAQSHGEA